MYNNMDALVSIANYESILFKYGFKMSKSCIKGIKLGHVKIIVFFFFLNIKKWIMLFKMKKEIDWRRLIGIKVEYKRTWY